MEVPTPRANPGNILPGPDSRRKDLKREIHATPTRPMKQSSVLAFEALWHSKRSSFKLLSTPPLQKMHKYLPLSWLPNSLPRISFLHCDVCGLSTTPLRLVQFLIYRHYYCPLHRSSPPFIALIRSLFVILILFFNIPLHTSVALFYIPSLCRLAPLVPLLELRRPAVPPVPYSSSTALSSIPLILTFLDSILSSSTFSK